MPDHDETDPGARPWDHTFERLLREKLPLLAADEPVVLDADLVGLGLDSMAMVELLTELEQAYHVRFPDESLTVATFRSPRTIWSVLSGATHGKAAEGW